MRPVAVSGPHPSPCRSAGPDCGTDGQSGQRSLPPPSRRGCPAQAGNRWPSSPPCPGHHSTPQHCGGSGQRRRPSRLLTKKGGWGEITLSLGRSDLTRRVPHTVIWVSAAEGASALFRKNMCVRPDKQLKWASSPHSLTHTEAHAHTLLYYYNIKQFSVLQRAKHIPSSADINFT